MAIYGQMTSNMKTDNDNDNEEDVPSLSDFDQGLEKLNRSIDNTLIERFDSKKNKTEEPHFTLDSSRTRRND